jgi:predicted CXXCH cytochrome family protein
LHLEAKHLVNGCVQCHAAHGTEAPGARQMCLTCHEEQVDHQPEAKRCDGCHAFIGSKASGGLP